MGVVWRARDSLLDRDVAIKEVFLNKATGDDERENSYKRAMREARTAARLSHRGVVTVYDVAEEDGRPWIIMELVPSRSLEQVLASDGPLPSRRACRVGQQLLAALAAAHAAGVLHRDVKPSNVLLADEPDGERAVLTDFGIAQFADDPRLTQTGMVMGSPGFTAPERIRGGKATPASDLWSLGATLFAAVEGRGPYEERGGAITTMSAIINEDAPPASSAGPLAPLIGALLNRAPATRPSAAAAARMFAGVLPLLPEPQPAARYTPTLVSAVIPAPPDADTTSADAATEPDDASPADGEAGDGPLADGGEGGGDPPAAEKAESETAKSETSADETDRGDCPAPRAPEPAAPRRGRGRRAVVAALVVALIAVTGAAAAWLSGHRPAPGDGTVSSSPPDPVKAIDSPLAALPSGWTREAVPPSEFGTAAGFSIGVPSGWSPRQRQLATFLDAPDGVRYLEIDLTKHDRTDMVAEAEYIERSGIEQGHLPGYHRISLQTATIRGSTGAFWAFNWVNRYGITMRADDLLFETPTTAGPQSYALEFAAPAADFRNDARPRFDRILRTFHPLTS